jgi:glycosyltransferase involved in cell wall biosynthesis
MSVVIPAHDERSIIERSLRRLVEGDAAHELEIVVVANGCTDGTAEVAAAVSERVRVLDIPTPSKIAALNAGDAAATVFPRAYVDADVTVDVPTLLALADALEAGGAQVASPRLVVDAQGSTWWARQYFRVWELSEYRRAGHIGSGIYALSAEGRGRFGAFPDVIADDRFVQQLFELPERLCLDDRTFTVRAPRTMRSQIRRATRIAVGNRQLPASLQVADAPGARRFLHLLGRVARRPRLWPALPVYGYGYAVPQVLARLRVARGVATGWDRDESSRVEKG